MAENPEQGNGAKVTIGVVKETASGETRVGLIPDSVAHLIGKGLNVIVESGAGMGSSIADDEYSAKGATIVHGSADVYAAADVVVRVQAPSPERGELDHLRRGQILVSYLAPLVNHELDRQLANTGVTAMAMDAVPRITRAQSMDALSAMGTISGYKAVLLAADHLPKFFPLLMTAAGTIRPARVLVLGAGVAGLQAIATARRLGAVVDAYDTRPVVKEQVESLGANFVVIDTGSKDTETKGGYAREATPEELRRQQEGLNEFIAKADVVVTTALVPGRPAPKLIPAEAVERMRHGSVIVDLAAETGGNCELTVPGEIANANGITIIGLLNLPATLPVHASQMYGKVITNFLDLLVKNGQIDLNFGDEIITGMCITHNGEIVHEQTRNMMGMAAPAAAQVIAEVVEPASDPVESLSDEIAAVDVDVLESFEEEIAAETDATVWNHDAEAVFEDEPDVTNDETAWYDEIETEHRRAVSEFAPDDDDELHHAHAESADPAIAEALSGDGSRRMAAEAAGRDESVLHDAVADDAVVHVEEEQDKDE